MTVEIPPTQDVMSILEQFLTAGFNLSPEALDYIIEENLSSHQIQGLLEELTFSPNIEAYLTLEGIQRIVEKKENAIPRESEKQDEISDLSNNLDSQKIPEPRESKPIPPEVVFQTMTASDPKTSNSFPKKYQEPTEVPTKPEKLLAQVQPSIDLTADQEHKLDDLKEKELIQELRKKKRKDWEQVKHGRSTSTFTPVAKDYDIQLKVLNDPTGKLFTEGKMHEFTDLMNDRFEKLKKILKIRPDGGNNYEISLINDLENSCEVKFIGMVKEKRQNFKKNYLIEMEDPTGSIMVFVPQKSEELHQLASYLLPDHVVMIEGYLKVDQKAHSRIILANSITFPDSPNTRTINTAQEDIAVCLISDTHFGSRDWLGNVWKKFVEYLNCRMGTEKQRIQAGKIKYLCIAGDIVDGIGVYPNQEKSLSLTNIYDQYEDCARNLQEIPDYIQIVIAPGDHDAVRKALPTPAIPKEYAQGIYDLGVKMVGCPAMLDIHGVKIQMFHGTSLIDMNMSIPGMANEDPVKTMQEFIRARHLAPMYGKKTEIAPVEQDWLVLETLPDILHTGHLHKNGAGTYHGMLLVNSGCFQGQTPFMDNLGIDPDYGKPTIVNLKDQLRSRVIDLVGD